MSMDHASRVDLGADEDVPFEPGGYYVMLTDIAAPLLDGETFELTLEFEQAETQIISVAVRDEAP